MEKKQKYFFNHLDSLRGIAAITIVLFHSPFQNSFLTDNPFVKNGGLMVDFFFVLSGFVISYTYSDRINNYKNLIQFQYKRFLRLYPLHILTFSAFLFLYLTEFVKDYFFDPGGQFINLSLYKADFFHNLFLTHNIFRGSNLFNGPSWSISTEFYTYLFFGLLTLILKNKIYSIIAYIFIILTSIILIQAYSSLNTNDEFALLRCFYSFFLGALLYKLFPKVHSNNNSIFAISSIFFVTIFVMFHPENISFIFPILCVFLIYFTNTSKTNFILVILKSKPLTFLGKISYGIYLIHYPLVYFYKAVIANPDTAVATVLQTEPSGTYDTINNLIYLSVVIVLSSISYLYFESFFYKSSYIKSKK